MSVPGNDPFNLIIAGVGGQGNILASSVIAQAALHQGIGATIGETYGVSQRGGSVMSHVRLSAGSSPGPLIPRGEAHVLVGFEPLETFQVALEFANRNTQILCSPRPVYPIGVLAGDWTYPPVERMLDLLRRHAGGLTVLEATEIARQAGDIRAANLVMVGAVAGRNLLPLAPDSYRAVLGELFQGKALEINRSAFELGLRAVETPA
jgi:indolepyruvate ferredoxin oxidoreductase, beta subunit